MVTLLNRLIADQIEEKMTIDVAKVSKIAQLARLAVSETEKQGLTTELNKIFEWVEQLNEVDVEGVAPLTSVNDAVLTWRADCVTDGNKPQDVLSNAPAQKADFFVVPKVIE